MKMKNNVMSWAPTHCHKFRKCFSVQSTLILYCKAPSIYKFLERAFENVGSRTFFKISPYIIWECFCPKWLLILVTPPPFSLYQQSYGFSIITLIFPFLFLGAEFSSSISWNCIRTCICWSAVVIQCRTGHQCTRSFWCSLSSPTSQQ